MLVKALRSRIFRHLTPLAVRYLEKPDLGTSNPVARRVLDQAAIEFQVVPPITVHLSDPDLMAGVWCLSREAYLVGAAGRATREAVALAVSRINQCPYCTTVHAGMYASTGLDPNQLESPASLTEDAKTAYEWAKATLSPHSALVRNPQVPAQDVPQVFGTAILYHYINRIAVVFLGKSPIALPGMASAPGRKFVTAVLRVLAKDLTRADPGPGRCVVTKRADVPPEFAWALPNPAVAASLAQFSLAAEKVADAAVPGEVRTLVLDHLADWHGGRAPLSRQWLEELVGPLESRKQPAARLALLSAHAPYQVDDWIIDEFRAGHPGDRLLLQTVAWASFAAARRISQWLQPPQTAIGPS